MIFLNFIKKNVLAIIMIFYFLIASSGIFFNFSLFNTTGDEAPLLSATLKMISDHSFRPNYPSFYHLGLGAYLYLPFFLIFLVWLRLSGLFGSAAALKQFGQIEFARFLPLGRFISVLTGLVSLYLLYKICQKLFNSKRVSLLAVFFLSTSLLFVQVSHFARIWPLQVMTILLAFYFIADFYQADRPRLKHYLLCGLGVGLAFGTHVVGIFTYVSFLAAHYFKNNSEKLKKIVFNKYFWSANFLFAMIYVLVYFLNTYGFTHYLGGLLPNTSKMLNLSETLSPLVNRPISETAAGTSTFSQSVIYYLVSLWQNEPLLWLTAFFGSIVMFFSRRKLFIIFYSFIIIYFLAVCSIGIKVSRYLLPLIPLLALLAAFGLNWLYEKTRYKKIIGTVIAAVCLLSLLPPLLWDYKFLLPSTRSEAAGWIYNNLPPSASIMNFDNHLELNENRQTLTDIKKYSSLFTKKRAYLLSSPDEVFPKPNYYIYTYLYYKEVPPDLREKKFDYAIISWVDKANYNYWRDKSAKFNLSGKNFILIKRFPAAAQEDDIGMDLGDAIDNPLFNLPKLKQNGPIVDIYKIKY